MLEGMLTERLEIVRIEKYYRVSYMGRRGLGSRQVCCRTVLAPNPLTARKEFAKNFPMAEVVAVDPLGEVA